MTLGLVVVAVSVVVVEMVRWWVSMVEEYLTMGRVHPRDSVWVGQLSPRKTACEAAAGEVEAMNLAETLVTLVCRIAVLVSVVGAARQSFAWTWFV